MALILSIIISLVIARVSAQCPDNYEIVSGKCLLFLPSYSLTFVDAREMCQSTGGDLAQMSGCTQMGDVANHIHSSGYSGVNYWLGAQDYIQEGTFQWFVGDEVPLDKLYWAAVDPVSPQPDEDGGDCVAMNSLDYSSLHNFDCETPLGVICEADWQGYCPGEGYIYTGNGICTLFITEGVTWDEAVKICERRNARFVAYKDCADFHLIRGQMESWDVAATYWIGGRRVNSTWQWVDGTPMKMGPTYWGRTQTSYDRQPDNNGEEDCLVLWADDQYYYNDVQCSSYNAPLCEAPFSV